jgi:hypothetical protein
MKKGVFLRQASSSDFQRIHSSLVMENDVCSMVMLVALP